MTETVFIPMFTDFGADRDEENRRYDTDHVPQRLSGPGFLRAERYERTTVVPRGKALSPLRYLNFYYVTGPEALTSDAYARQFAHRTPRSARMALRPVAPWARDVWVRRPSPWQGAFTLAAAEGPQTLLVLAHDVRDDESDEYLDHELVPIMLRCPGFLRCDRYERSEVDLPGAPEPQPAHYLTIFRLAAPEVVTTADYRHSAELVDGDAMVEHWSGVYLQRPSPWTVRPVT